MNKNFKSIIIKWLGWSALILIILFVDGVPGDEILAPIGGAAVQAILYLLFKRKKA